jgi:NADH dehydrogenase FAD-containing subunit
MTTETPQADARSAGPAKAAGDARRDEPAVDGARSERGERVVIVGAGFGGLSCALGLARTNHAVTVIDRHNYHLFQPLLYQVATAGLSPADIAYPIRAALRDARNVSVVLAKATGVDTRRREVIADGAVSPTTSW